jgi:hypothetical protein
MDPALADREIRIAAKWWRDLLVRRHEEALTADHFTSIAEHAPMCPERADAFQTALVEEIQVTFGMELVLWDTSVPSSGAGRRILRVDGTRAPSEVVRAADSAGLSRALRHLPEGSMTAIHPGYVVSHAGCPAVWESTDIAALCRGGAS